MVGFGYLEAGKSPVRNGNRYNAATGARETALNTAGAAFPAMEVYAFDTGSALEAASQGYNGNVTLHEFPNGPLTVILMTDDTGPVDHFVKQGSRIVRSDRWGNPSTELENLKPDNSGVVFTGEVGPGASLVVRDPVHDAWFKRIETMPEGRQAQFYTTGVMPGDAIVLEFPAAPGRLQGVEKSGTAPATRHVSLMHDGTPAEVREFDPGTSLDGVNLIHNGGFYRAEITSPGASGPCDMSLVISYDKS